MISVFISLFFPSLEVLCKWSLLQAGWSGVSDDRRRGPGQSSLDAAGHLAHLCREAGGPLHDAGTSLLWKESPDPVCLTFAVLTIDLVWCRSSRCVFRRSGGNKQFSQEQFVPIGSKSTQVESPNSKVYFCRQTLACRCNALKGHCRNQFANIVQ